MSINKKKMFMSPFLAKLRLGYKTASRLVVFLALAAFFVAPKIVWAEIVINEIMYDLPSPGTDDKHEWVELYNSGPLETDLTGWKFNDGSNHLLNPPSSENGGRGSLVLPIGGYLLLADDATTLAIDLPNYSGTIIDTVMDLNNTSESLKLITKDSQEVSLISYTKELGATGNGRTLEWNGAALRESAVDGGTPGQANSVLNYSNTTPSAAPSVSPSATPAATATNTATPSPSATVQTFDYSKDILINEFLPWPASDGDKEWIELVNASDETINLASWQIDDADNSTAPQIIPANTTIAVGDFLVITFNKSTLNNDGDKIRLLWPDDQVVHSVEYKKANSGQSVARFNSDWFWTNQPTPGSANKKSVAESNKPTAIITATEKISPIEESIIVSVGQTSNKKTPASQTTISSTPISSIASQPTNSPENINLSATIGESIKKTSKITTILSLTGVILLAGLAAGALIYFRRQKAVDSQNFDD